MAQLVKTIGGLVVASCKTVGGLAIASVKTIGGLDNSGSSPTWYDAVAGASTDTTDTGSNFNIASPIVAGQSGNCTKLRAWCRAFGGVADNVKLSLYDNAFALLGTVTANSQSPSAGSYVELALTPVAVTASSTYYVAAIAQTSFIQWGYLNGVGTYYVDLTAYASSPPDPMDTGITGSGTLGFGMYIE